MVTYNDLINRTDASSLIPEEVEAEIFKNIPEQSGVLSMGRRLRNMARQEEKLRVTEGLVTAYFVGSTTAVSGDNARIQTSDSTWGSVSILAAKIGVIVPIPKDVLDDQDYDLWAEVQPQIAEAFGVVIDAAVLYGTDAPSDWPTAIVTNAVAKSQVVYLADKTDLYDALLGEDGTVDKVESSGYFVDGHMCAISMRAKLRDARTTAGQPIFTKDPQQKSTYFIDGERCVFPRNGAFSAANSLAISGDWRQLVYSLRKGITYEVLTEASIFNSSGTLQFALAQDDMVALKAVLRMGWQLPLPASRLTATPYPFAVLKSGSAPA